MTDFLPVLLGSDANVYGMARSFYQQYGVRSVAICKGALVATANSNLVKIAVLEPELADAAGALGVVGTALADVEVVEELSIKTWAGIPRF